MYVLMEINYLLTFISSPPEFKPRDGALAGRRAPRRHGNGRKPNMGQVNVRGGSGGSQDPRGQTRTAETRPGPQRPDQDPTDQTRTPETRPGPQRPDQDPRDQTRTAETRPGPQRPDQDPRDQTRTTETRPGPQRPDQDPRDQTRTPETSSGLQRPDHFNITMTSCPPVRWACPRWGRDRFLFSRYGDKPIL